MNQEILIRITASMRDHRDTYPKLVEGLAVQIYDLYQNKWLLTFTDLQAPGGKMMKELQPFIPQKGTAPGFDNLRKYLEQGLVPTFRLIRQDTAHSQWTEVLAFAPVLHMNQDTNTFTVDFGDLWLLNEQTVNRHIAGENTEVEFTHAAFTRPNGRSAIFPALMAAVADTEAFKGYKTGEHEIRYATKPEWQEIDSKVNDVIISPPPPPDGGDDGGTTDGGSDTDGGGATDDKEYPDKDGALTATVSKLTDGENPLKNILENIVDDVDVASKRTSEHQYTLTNFNVKLKASLTTKDGELQAKLPDSNTDLNAIAGTLSEIEFGIDPDGKGQAAVAAPVQTPRVTGYTETMVRKKLLEAGLQAEIIYQPTESHTYGQAFKQVPEAGAKIVNNGTVVVIIAKDQENFN